MGNKKSKHERQETPTPAATKEKAVVSGKGLGPGWSALTAAEQQDYFGRWNLVAKGKSKISTSQFMDMIIASKAADKEMAKLIVDAYDLNGDGVIDVDEFKTFVALGLKGSEEDKLRASFHVFDTSNNGLLERDELKLKLRAVVRGKRFSNNISAEEDALLDQHIDEAVDKVFELVDTDKSGTIDVKEFVEGFLHNKQVACVLDDIVGRLGSEDSPKNTP